LKIVTTCHKAGWEQYGQKCLDGLKYWPKNAEIVWYTEGFDLPPGRAREVKNETLPLLAQFKAKYAHYVAPSWRYDVVRFANKVYAVWDALRGYDGLGIWMDADIVAHSPLPADYVESLLPKDAYIALFQREGWHSECGLWLVDCSHPEHKRFMDTLIGWYEQGTFTNAHEWHDSVLMDATVRALEREKLIVSHNLSGAFKGKEHPMALHSIAAYVDHLKGPSRKEKGYSPERIGMRYTQLIEAVRAKQPKVILEVGTWNGDRAREMLKAAPGAHYIGFDLFEDATPETDAVEMNVKRSSKVTEVQQKLGERATLVKGNTRETLAAFSWPELVDFVWIDGGHSVETVASDWANVQRLLASDAEVYFDDYYTGGIDTLKFGCNTVVDELPHELLPAKDRVVTGGFTQIARVLGRVC
jgi:predicted O-methyltransferase YrrM